MHCISFLVLQLSCFCVAWFVWYLPRCDRSTIIHLLTSICGTRTVQNPVFHVLRTCDQKLITYNDSYDQNTSDFPVSQKVKRLLRTGVNLPEHLWDIVFVHLSVSLSHTFFLTIQINPTLPNILQWPSSLWVQEMTWHAAYVGEEVSKSRKHLSHVLYLLDSSLITWGNKITYV